MLDGADSFVSPSSGATLTLTAIAADAHRDRGVFSLNATQWLSVSRTEGSLCVHCTVPDTLCFREKAKFVPYNNTLVMVTGEITDRGDDYLAVEVGDIAFLGRVPQDSTPSSSPITLGMLHGIHY